MNSGLDEQADPNDEYLRVLAGRADRLIEAGMDREDAVRQAATILTDALHNSAASMASAYEQSALEYASQMGEYIVGFEERLRVHWGDALDLYSAIVEIIQYVSNHFWSRDRDITGDHEAILIGVLHRLNGQALRVAREVHALCAKGYPLGALSLARTNHEISVRATVLSEFGTGPGCTDLAERFVRHADYINYTDAKIYQRDAEALGYEPFGEETMAELKRRYDEVLQQYNKPFRSSYGWASELPGLSNPTPTFADLEELAGLAHHRGLYKWSSHLVHADAKALRLSMVERGGRVVVMTAATNQALADPAQHALLGLYRTFVSLVTCVPISFYDLHICHALSLLIDKADELLVGAEWAVDEAEERLQAELAEQGMRFDPIDGEVPLT